MKKKINVRQFFEEIKNSLSISLLTSKKGFENKISNSQVQKPGLALAGFLDSVKSETISIFGNTEISYLSTLSEDEASKAVERLLKLGLPCIVVSNENKLPPHMVELGEKYSTPIMVAKEQSSYLISVILDYLAGMLSESITMHGVLVDVFGVGVLILGKSGVGKSEIVLDLVEKGHRLVSDDVVEIKKNTPMTLIGASPESIRYHMEIRGLGIINIKDLFGVTSIRDKKKVELVIELEEWDQKKEYDRVGLDEIKAEILGVKLPKVLIPVGPGRNMSMIIEIAARNYLLKRMGYHPAEELNRKLLNKMIEESKIN
ncbi:MAG: HPr(Ser) kinase/phosphatase [Candidatus Schekmanbacteria bacterium]|nr:MAG: HPr(Ser) kinase/phosphatase [Candidatus Schekmanbacteria bacterium]